MSPDDFIPHINALKDVVDIQFDENQDIITFGRVGREKVRKVVVAMAIFVAVVTYIVVQLTVEAVIVGFVILAAVGWYLSDGFRSVVVDLKRKRISSSLFNIISDDYKFEEYCGPLVYMLTLNGREPSPKEFCAKFWHNGHRKEITIANLTDGDGSPDKVQLTHILELWHQLEDLMETDDFDTEFQMSARNAIFA